MRQGKKKRWMALALAISGVLTSAVLQAPEAADTSKQLLDWAKRVQFKTPTLRPYEAVYDIEEEKEATETPQNEEGASDPNTQGPKQERTAKQETDRVLGGQVKISLRRHSDFWRHKEEGTYQLMREKGGMVTCKWSYTFDEDLDGRWLRFSYQRFEGEDKKAHHVGKATFNPIQQTLTLSWQKPRKDYLLLGRRVFFPLSFRQYLYKRLDGSWHHKPVLLDAYVFTGQEALLLSARECVMSSPQLMVYKKKPRVPGGEPILGWPINCAFYREKVQGKRLLPTWWGRMVVAEHGVPLTYQACVGGKSLSCRYRPGALTFLGGNK